MFAKSLPVLLLLLAGCSTRPPATAAPQVRSLPVLPSPSVITPTPSPTPTPTQLTPLTSSDGKSQLRVPAGWSAETGLNPEAQIQASNRSQGLFLIVLAESRQQLRNVTREKHSQITRDLLIQNLAQSKVSEPTTVTAVKDNPAIQYEISGSLNDINVQFLHTTIETPTRFVQILAWTSPEAFERNRTELQNIIQSFVEP